MADTEIKSIFDMEPDAAHEARLDAEAEADYAAGRVISHERMMEWLAKLAKGEKLRHPQSGNSWRLSGLWQQREGLNAPTIILSISTPVPPCTLPKPCVPRAIVS